VWCPRGNGKNVLTYGSIRELGIDEPSTFLLAAAEVSQVAESAEVQYRCEAEAGCKRN
jgi:hypothetical protein